MVWLFFRIVVEIKRDNNVSESIIGVGGGVWDLDELFC